MRRCPGLTIVTCWRRCWTGPGRSCGLIGPRCFYTDGLVERRGELIDDGLDRLCRAVMAQPAEAACAAVMRALVGNEPARDDIALLMVRRQGGVEGDADA